MPKGFERCRECGVYWTQGGGKKLLGFVFAMAIVALALWILVLYGPGPNGPLNQGTSSSTTLNEAEKSSTTLNEAEKAVCDTFAGFQDTSLLLTEGHDTLVAQLIQKANEPTVRKDLSAAAIAFAHATAGSGESDDAYRRVREICP